ncbi:MAG: HEAT repeat domain-containing protein [Anaerolineae bacterium]|nr:HEAT repeat domain-containing protein [Anaerolineae bacterium]
MTLEKNPYQPQTCASVATLPPAPIELQRVIRRTLDELQTDDMEARRAALDRLVRIGPDALPVLLVALMTRDERTREAAAWALGELGDTRAVPELLRRLHEEQSALVRDAVTWALELIGDARAIPELLVALAHDEESVVRDGCAEALSAIGGGDALPGLFDALQSPDPEVRQAAVWALGNLCACDISAVPHLTRALDDSDGRVRWIAAWALQKYFDPETVEALARRLSDTFEPPWAQRVPVSRMALDALISIGTPEAHAAIRRSRAIH